jgi:hypothetical protein
MLGGAHDLIISKSRSPFWTHSMMAFRDELPPKRQCRTFVLGNAVCGTMSGAAS